MIQVIDTYLKRLFDNRFYWNVIEGPLYNILIYRSLDRAYGAFLNTLSFPPKAKILDIGSGAGQATMRLAVRYPEASIHAIDYAVIQVCIARLLKRFRRVRNTIFRVGDALHMPFQDEAFDGVVSLGSIKHWIDVSRGFAEVHRVLRRGCWAHIIECDAGAEREEIDAFAARATGFSPLKRVVAWYQEHVVFGQGTSREEVARMGREAGFSEVIVRRMRELPYFHLALRR